MTAPATDRNGSKKGRFLPPRLILVASVVLQIFAAVDLTGWISLPDGQQVVNDLATQLYGKIAARIQTKAKAIAQISQLNPDDLQIGEPHLKIEWIYEEVLESAGDRSRRNRQSHEGGDRPSRAIAN